MFLHLSVILFTEGVSASGPGGLSATPGQTQPPPGQTPPCPVYTPLPSACWDTPCPPCAMHAGIRSTSGWYTSYCNADLFLFNFSLFNSIKMSLYYRPQRSWDKVIFSQASVILFSRGGALPQCMLGYHPPGPGTPQEQAPPQD